MVIVASFIIPVLLGNSFSILCKKDKNIANYYIYGTISLFAIIQLVGVPFVFLKKSFHLTFYIVLIISIVLSVLGLVIKVVKKDLNFKINKKMELVYILVTLIVGTLFLYLVITHQHIDEDDSRFVVYAADMLETDTMYQMNPATGYSKDLYYCHELQKDVVSPWSIYIAYLAKFTGIKVVSIAHSFMPLSLSVFTMCIWWEFAGKVFKKNTLYQSMFLILVLLIAVYSNHQIVKAVNPSLTKFILRLWQGKAVVASAGIPLLFIQMFDYYEKQDLYNLIAMLVCNFGVCLMSANGMLLCSAIIGGFSFIYSIILKKPMSLVKVLPVLMVNIVHYLLYVKVSKGGF